MIDTEEAQGILCLACSKPVQQRFGYRKRLYCNDVCKTSYHRQKAREAQQAALLDGYLPETQQVLEEAQRHSMELAQRVRFAINAEKSQFDIASTVITQSDRAKIEAKFMALGESLQYRALLLVGIMGGVSYWQSFMERANDETLLNAIAAAEAFYENLAAPRLEQYQRRIADLESENRKLQGLLDADTLYRQDTKERHFQAWLKKQGTSPQGSFQARLIADKAIPQQASRALYIQTLRKLGYSAEDMETFRDLWIVMIRLS